MVDFAISLILMPTLLGWLRPETARTPQETWFTAPMRVDSPAEVAALMQAKWDLGLAGGVVVANPIPAESEIPADEIGAIIDRALADMDRLGIRGKDATPYLLGRIVEITDGASLTANIALVEHNARLGAAIAREYAARQRP